MPTVVPVQARLGREMLVCADNCGWAVLQAWLTFSDDKEGITDNQGR